MESLLKYTELSQKIEQDLKSINLKTEIKEKEKWLSRIQANNSYLSITGKKTGLTIEVQLYNQPKMNDIKIRKRNERGGMECPRITRPNGTYLHYQTISSHNWDNDIFPTIKTQIEEYICPTKTQIEFKKFIPVEKDTKLPIDNIGDIFRIFSVSIVGIENDIIIEDLHDPNLENLYFLIMCTDEQGGDFKIVVDPKVELYCYVDKYGKNRKKLVGTMYCGMERYSEQNTKDQELIKRAIKIFKGEQDDPEEERT
jgi:hypothetical protein